jgi:hypothetical protein
MHIDITENLKKCLARAPRKTGKSNFQSTDNSTALIGAPPSVLSSRSSSSTRTNANKMAVSIATTPTSVIDQPNPIENATTVTSGGYKFEPKQGPFEKIIKLEVELHDNEEYNISHISISAVAKKSTNEVNSKIKY